MSREDEAPEHVTVPDALFKYRSISGESRAFTQRLISHGELYFSSPRDFNDPFDTLPHLMLAGTRAERRRHLKGIATRGMMDRPRLERRAATRSMLQTKPDVLQGYFVEAAAKSMGGVGVCCLAQSHESVLMWSHYSDQHRGVCVAVDPRGLLAQRGLALPVHYSDQRPTYNPVKHRTEGLIDALMIKAKGWEYEQEWRMTTPAPGPRTFGPHVVTGVYLGCRITPDGRDAALEAVRARSRPIPVFQAEASPDRFALTFKRVELD